MARPEGRFPSTAASAPDTWTSGGLRGRKTSSRFGEGDEWTASAPPDALVAEIAARQHGIVTLAQLEAAGLSEKAIRHRVRSRYITRRHSGIYQVGPVADPLAEPFAAVLACGPTGVLSHHSALHLHGLTNETPRPVHVTVTAGRPRPTGVVVHRAVLAPGERTERDGIPVTTPARAILDVAVDAKRRELDRLVEQAIVLGIADEGELQIAASAPRRGAKRVRAILADLAGPSLTRSEAERRLLELVRAAGLPAPVTNAKLGGYEVDLLWPRHRLVVEVDGYAFHGTRQAFERDRRRDAQLQLDGYRVIRVTWRQIADEQHA
ncbi:MAG TPA: type IV toxin-antitoxin system AbiEi family antitoxin domain-containing protein, partial [Solirubrobacteraceae bacterium]|nr:type IV toxin-antitoxin system AbiEi family antitoxin domain-containing protein [Solirubrobacteraceae bacterium]